MKQPKKKLIEVALPLEAINGESAREKSIRHGHPHPASVVGTSAAGRLPGRPLRLLVDDPPAHPEQFPTEEAQERSGSASSASSRSWSSGRTSTTRKCWTEARAEILQSHRRQPAARARPLLRRRLHPPGGPAARAGGPRQRPQPGRRADQQGADRDPAQVRRPAARPSRAWPTVVIGGWDGRHGAGRGRPLLRRWMRDEAEKRIGHLYPKVKLPKEYGGGEATVIAWLWARTVTCPNPACGVPMCRWFVPSGFRRRKGRKPGWSRC